MVIDPQLTLLSSPLAMESSSSPMPSLTDQANSGEGSFQSVLAQTIGQVNQLQLEASSQQQAVNAGLSDDLAGAMVASQQANISFSALLQVRNKLSSALDDILNTPL